MEIKRGDIFLADLSPVVGNEMGGICYVVAIQNDQLNDEVSLNGGTVIVAPIKSTPFEGNATKAMLHIDIPALSLFRNDYQILLFQPRAIDVKRLKERIDRLSNETLAMLDEKLKYALGL